MLEEAWAFPTLMNLPTLFVLWILNDILANFALGLNNYIFPRTLFYSASLICGGLYVNSENQVVFFFSEFMDATSLYHYF